MGIWILCRIELLFDIRSILWCRARWYYVWIDCPVVFDFRAIMFLWCVQRLKVTGESVSLYAFPSLADIVFTSKLLHQRF